MMSSLLQKTLKESVLLLQSPSNNKQDATFRALLCAIAKTGSVADIHDLEMSIQGNLTKLRLSCSKSSLSLSEKRECLFLTIHLSNLGKRLYPCVYPFVVKCMEDSETSFDKLLAHIALRILSRMESSVVYLAVNSLEKEIRSTKKSVSYLALGTLACVVDLDLIPVFLPYVMKIFKISHDASLKYQVLTVIDVMNSLGSEYISDIWGFITFALCDKSPHVMRNSLPVLKKLLEVGIPPTGIELNNKIMFILHQILDGRLPLDMMYGGICDPWDFISLLQLLRILPSEQWSRGSFGDLTVILELALFRLRTTSYIQVAVISECIQTYLYFYDKLDVEKLEKIIIQALENIMLSCDRNILHTGVELLASINAVKPTIVKVYEDAMLVALNESNPSSFATLVGIIANITSSEDAQQRITVLMKKLSTVVNLTMRKDIILGILKILEKHPSSVTHSNWLLKNFPNLLKFFHQDLDFSIVNRIVNCVKTTKNEVLNEELLLICKQLELKCPPLQYCVMLEILNSYHNELSKQDCEDAVSVILRNCYQKDWKTNSENIIFLSWMTVGRLAGYHKLQVDMEDFIKAFNPRFSIMLQMQFSEMHYMLSDQKRIEMFFGLPDIGTVNFKQNLSCHEVPENLLPIETKEYVTYAKRVKSTVIIKSASEESAVCDNIPSPNDASHPQNMHSNSKYTSAKNVANEYKRVEPFLSRLAGTSSENWINERYNLEKRNSNPSIFNH